MLEQQLKASNEINQSLETAFLVTNQLLRTSSEIDCTFSGTTTVLCLILGNELYVANVGDSRAIISQTNGIKALSRDHKPDSDGEHERVIAAGGRVESYHDQLGNPVGPARVWLQSLRMPGLAMARSMGDNVASIVGVIAEPEITKFELTKKDKFIVIASDGVFEFLSNEQVAGIVEPFYKTNQPDKAAEKLVKESTISWQKEDGPIDDITCIVIFFLQENKQQQ